MVVGQGKLSVFTKIESGLTAVVGLLAVVTIFWRDWIEALTGWDPDHHDGTAEVYIVLGLALVAIALGLLTRVSWKRDRARRVAPA